MPSFNHTLAVDSSADHLWALVRDTERLAGLFPFMSLAGFESPEPDCWLFWRSLAIPNVASLRWREKMRIEGSQVKFEAVEGDLETFDGCWLVTPRGDGATLSLSLEYAIPEHLAPNMPTMLVNYVVGEVFKTMCGRVKEAAEEGAA